MLALFSLQSAAHEMRLVLLLHWCLGRTCCIRHASCVTCAQARTAVAVYAGFSNEGDFQPSASAC